MSAHSAYSLKHFAIGFCCDVIDTSNYEKVSKILEILEREFAGHVFQWIWDDENDSVTKTDKETLIREKISANESVMLFSNNDENTFMSFTAFNSGPTPTLDSSHHFSFSLQLSADTEWVNATPDFMADLGDSIDARFGFAGESNHEVYAVMSYSPNIQEKYYDSVHQNIREILTKYPEFVALPSLRPFEKSQFPTFTPKALGWINYWSPKTCDLLRFPNIPDDQRWMTHSQKTEKGAWVVCLTESPLDISSAQDRQILVDAYQRFYLMSKANGEL